MELTVQDLLNIQTCLEISIEDQNTRCNTNPNEDVKKLYNHTIRSNINTLSKVTMLMQEAISNLV